jgi:hypothetical protein
MTMDIAKINSCQYVLTLNILEGRLCTYLPYNNDGIWLTSKIFYPNMISYGTNMLGFGINFQSANTSAYAPYEAC